MKLNEITNPHAEIEALLQQYKIENYTIRPDGTVDVDGDVDLSDSKFDRLPVKFGTVTGFFDCALCSNLLSLEGAPHTVGDFFDCSYCPLMKSLVCAPKHVGAHFAFCDCNSLETLDGAPLTVGGPYFEGSKCPNMTSLEGFNVQLNSAAVYFMWDKIKTGGISLLLCNTSVHLYMTNEPFKIIEKYLGRPEDIFECQAELINAGYEEYARL